jgi:hypothetical protein
MFFPYLIQEYNTPNSFFGQVNGHFSSSMFALNMVNKQLCFDKEK